MTHQNKEEEKYPYLEPVFNKLKESSLWFPLHDEGKYLLKS